MFLAINYIILLVAPNCLGSHAQQNNSDVIITYAGHMEALGDVGHVIPVTEKTGTREKIEERVFDGAEKPITDQREPPSDVNEDKDEVVFIPNDETRQIDDEGYLENEKTVGHLLNERRTLNDVVNRRTIFENTESPQNPDVLFVTGKNNRLENIDDTNYRRSGNKGVHGEASRRTEDKTYKTIKKVDCTNLDCNRTRLPVCGAKLDGHTWRYRLFLNECFLNKVNCGFKFDVNKYNPVPVDKCQTVGAHALSDRGNKFIYFPPAPLPATENRQVEGVGLKARRALAGRRSQNLELNGRFCGHACPLSCLSDYAPECALSSTGIKKVFLNHCSLDFDSCTNNVAWQQRPLGECVGNQQAELRQNRAFVGWMQRVGIIDAKGRFVHE